MENLIGYLPVILGVIFGIGIYTIVDEYRKKKRREKIVNDFLEFIKKLEEE